MKDVAYTLTSCDVHSVYTRVGWETFKESEVVGALCSGDHKGAGSQYVSQDKCVIDGDVNSVGNDTDILLIRRLTPLECERLQGFPDYWTDIASGSDSARYKPLGNSVAIPCVEYIMGRIALYAEKCATKGAEM